MSEIMIWSGFIGTWLLFAGAVYQAALELSGEDMALERIRHVQHYVEKPPSVSYLWWLLPPLKLYLEHHRSIHYRQELMRAASPEDRELIQTFFNKSASWLIVAGGGLLIAFKESFEVSEMYTLSLLWFGLLTLVMALMSVLYTVTRMRRARRIIDESAV